MISGELEKSWISWCLERKGAAVQGFCAIGTENNLVEHQIKLKLIFRRTYDVLIKKRFVLALFASTFRHPYRWVVLSESVLSLAVVAPPKQCTPELSHDGLTYLPKD
uniref:Uncharacterized protein n=1 Tax=Ananas comosus var. bracteatus TaxID=296719 RepID=A0A6V7PHH9_ANACO|nr:unnamed protein product [Ananas comosus var. bracteatus]